jgi:hypothetical protein
MSQLENIANVLSPAGCLFFECLSDEIVLSLVSAQNGDKTTQQGRPATLCWPRSTSKGKESEHLTFAFAASCRTLELTGAQMEAMLPLSFATDAHSAK